jgi:hypothetical protein
MRLAVLTSVMAGLIAASSAQASIVFSNYSSVGPVGPGIPTFGPLDVDISFDYPAGVVGDPVDPLRIGTVTLTFDGDSNAGDITGVVISTLGAAAGSGLASFHVSIMDRIVPGEIGAMVFAYDTTNPPPAFVTVAFSRGTTSFRVSTEIVLSASETPSLDLAQVSLVEMFFVPSTGTLPLLALAPLALRRRR